MHGNYSFPFFSLSLCNSKYKFAAFHVFLCQNVSLQLLVYWHQFKLNLIEIRRIAKPKKKYEENGCPIKLLISIQCFECSYVSSFFARCLCVSSKYQNVLWILFIYFLFARRGQTHTINKWLISNKNWSVWTRHDRLYTRYTLNLLLLFIFLI